MKFVIFGLSVTSSWGNGHATLWRGMLKAMAARGHRVLFYERDVSYYANTRDGWIPPRGTSVRLYDDLGEIRAEAESELNSADVAMSTSYCPDGRLAAEIILSSRAAVRAFYDLDTPVTLTALRLGQEVSYLPAEGLGSFDLVLSYTGGHASDDLRRLLGARRICPLYGWFDPETHHPVRSDAAFECTLSYLGTYAADRQRSLEELFVKPARRLPGDRLIVAGAQYPADFPWSENIFFMRHLPPALHPALFCSSRATLNVTRAAMAAYGYCPSGRLFEAAACGATILTDWWEGMETFFEPEREVLRVDSGKDVLQALARTDGELRRIGHASKERALAEHTAAHRLVQLEAFCEAALASGAQREIAA